jgi:chromosome transmission fidelity protein 8
MEDDGITPIGRLEFPESVMTGQWDGKSVWAYIGEHQRMRGEVKKLKTPLGVLRRKTVGNPPSEGVEGEELEIVEIIKYKILFSERPEPVS